MKSSTISLLMATFLITGTISLYAQKNYVPGYVVTFSGDTIHGYIDYRNWAKNPRTIKFKNSTQGVGEELGTNQVSRFFVNGEYYQRAVVRINERNFNMDDLNSQVEPKFWNDTTFLLAIIEGDKSLYHVKLADREDYFFYVEKDTFLTYDFSKYIRMVNGKRYLGKSTLYVTQMIDYLKDCPTIQGRIGKTTYTLSALRKTYDEYFKCTNTRPSYEIKQEKSSEFGILAGVSLTYLRYKSSAHPYLASLDFPGSLNFSAGFFADFIIPRNFQRWSAYNELNWTSYQTTAEYTDFKNENNYTVSNTSIGNNYIMFMSMIRYCYPIHNISVFVNGGLSFGFAFTYTDQVTSTQYFYDQVRVSNDTGYNNRNFEFGCAAGLGVKYWHFTFETRYNKPFYPGTSSPTNRFYFLLGYTF
jgi:hypothetical protein